LRIAAWEDFSAQSRFRHIFLGLLSLMKSSIVALFAGRSLEMLCKSAPR
jgi:hypothetical protein